MITTRFIRNISTVYSQPSTRFCPFRASIGLGLSLLILIAAAMAGCSSASIALKEKFGYAKREQLVDRVRDARDEQEEAREQFASALDEFLAVTRAQPGELEDRYRDLSRSYDRSEDRAESVRERIRDVERVADALFREWEDELDAYSSESLRRSSANQLDATRDRYADLLAAMKRAEASMEPVLAAFRDQVLFLKHNLNARAIASLENNVAELQTDVAALIAEMESSIAEANMFIEQMESDERE